MGSNPAEVDCEVFSTDSREALSIQCYTHVGVEQKFKISSHVVLIMKEKGACPGVSGFAP